MICDNCKKKINEADVYCNYCGKKHRPSTLDKLDNNLNNFQLGEAQDKDGNIIESITVPSLSLGDLFGKPDYHYFLQRGLELSDEGKYYEALEYCNRAAKLQPDIALIYNRRGLVYYNLDKLKEAITDYNMALQIDPQFTHALLNRGVVKSELGLNEEAIEDYNKVLKLQPENLNALNNRAGSKLMIGDFNGTKQDILIVLETYPNDEKSLYILAKALLNLGQKQEAIKYFVKSAELGFDLSVNELRKI